MLNKCLVTSMQILNYGFYAILQGKNELEPRGKGSPGYPEECLSLLARSEWSEACLCYHVGFITKWLSWKCSKSFSHQIHYRFKGFNIFM